MKPLGHTWKLNRVDGLYRCIEPGCRAIYDVDTDDEACLNARMRQRSQHLNVVLQQAQAVADRIKEHKEHHAELRSPGLNDVLGSSKPWMPTDPVIHDIPRVNYSGAKIYLNEEELSNVRFIPRTAADVEGVSADSTVKYLGRFVDGDRPFQYSFIVTCEDGSKYSKCFAAAEPLFPAVIDHRWFEVGNTISCKDCGYTIHPITDANMERPMRKSCEGWSARTDQHLFTKLSGDSEETWYECMLCNVSSRIDHRGKCPARAIYNDVHAQLVAHIAAMEELGRSPGDRVTGWVDEAASHAIASIYCMIEAANERELPSLRVLGSIQRIIESLPGVPH